MSSFQEGGTKFERFLPKNQHTHRKLLNCESTYIPIGNYWILRIGAVASFQKFGIILVIKWFKNWCYQKMTETKNVLLNCYPSKKKKLRKIPMIFDIENLTLKVKCWQFLKPPHNTNSQNPIISFWYVNPWAFFLLILYPRLKTLLPILP